MTAETFYHIARPDGWDFYTGRTINYRTALKANGGDGRVKAPNPATSPHLCAPGILHASRIAEDCFHGGAIPCSLFRVRGIPVVEDDIMAGFSRLTVVKELDPAKHFLWRYAEAAEPIHPFKLVTPSINDEVIELLKAWANVGASVRDSVGISVQDYVKDSVGTGVRDSVWDSLWASVRGSRWVGRLSSVEASMKAYVGWIFQPVVPQWAQIYPYQAAVDLWRLGLVPSYDGQTWRLHGGKDGRILWEL